MIFTIIFTICSLAAGIDFFSKVSKAEKTEKVEEVSAIQEEETAKN